MRASRWVYVVCSALLTTIGCTGSSERTLTVFAASSLTDAFTELADTFEADHPGVRVRLHFAGSQTLSHQIEQGAPADVFASAEARALGELVQRGELHQSVPFAAGALALIVPHGNPARIESLHDLTRVRRLVLALPSVPLGEYTAELLERASEHFEEHDFRDRVLARAVSLEPSARLVRAKVSLGEADAALVYRSDSDAEGCQVIAIPPEVQVQAVYQQAPVRGPREEDARAWVAFVSSSAAQSVLIRHGFEAVP